MKTERTTGEMDELYHGSNPGGGQPSQDQETPDQPNKGMGKEDENAETAIVSKSIFGDSAKEGSDVMVHIVKIHGDEVEISAAEMQPEHGETDEQPMSADDELETLDKQ